MMIEEEARNEFAKLMFKFDVDNAEHIKAIKHNQIYQTARDDLLKNIDSHTREIYTPSNE